MGAVAELLITVGAGVAGRAATRVRALARVETGAAVSARLMVGAVVEVLVAEQPAPAFVAQTVPRLLAGTVSAVRIRFAFVAQSTLPATVTSAKHKKDKTQRVRGGWLNNMHNFHTKSKYAAGKLSYVNSRSSMPCPSINCTAKVQPSVFRYAKKCTQKKERDYKDNRTKDTRYARKTGSAHHILTHTIAQR